MKESYVIITMIIVGILAIILVLINIEIGVIVSVLLLRFITKIKMIENSKLKKEIKRLKNAKKHYPIRYFNNG